MPPARSHAPQSAPGPEEDTFERDREQARQIAHEQQRRGPVLGFMATVRQHPYYQGAGRREGSMRPANGMGAFGRDGTPGRAAPAVSLPPGVEKTQDLIGSKPSTLQTLESRLADGEQPHALRKPLLQPELEFRRAMTEASRLLPQRPPQMSLIDMIARQRQRPPQSSPIGVAARQRQSLPQTSPIGIAARQSQPPSQISPSPTGIAARQTQSLQISPIGIAAQHRQSPQILPVGIAAQHRQPIPQASPVGITAQQRQPLPYTSPVGIAAQRRQPLPQASPVGIAPQQRQSTPQASPIGIATRQGQSLDQTSPVGIAAQQRQPSHFKPHYKQPFKQVQLNGTNAPTPALQPALPTFANPGFRTQRQKNLRSASPENRNQRRLRSNSPEKRSTKKLSAYEEFQKIERDATQDVLQPARKRKSATASPKKRSTKKLSTYEVFQKIEREATQEALQLVRERKPTPASPEKSFTKRLSAYEEIQEIEKPAAQGVLQSARKRKSMNAPEKSNKRICRDSSPDSDRTYSQATPVTMNQSNSEQLQTLQEQSQVQPRPSEEAARRMMPPPPVPRPAPGSAHMLSRNQPSHPIPPSQNMAAFRGSTNKAPISSNPSRQPASKPIQEMVLHKTQNPKITKQNFHTLHRRQPYSTQEAQKRARLNEVEFNALRKKQQQEQHKRKLEEHVFKESMRRNGQLHGVHMMDVELTDMPYQQCKYYASENARFVNIDVLHRDLPIPSVEDRDLPVPSVEDVIDLTGDDEVAGPSNAASVNRGHSYNVTDSTMPLEDAEAGPSMEGRASAVPESFFDEPAPIDQAMDFETYNLDVVDDLFTLDPSFLPKQPYRDEDGYLRAPEPDCYTEQRAELEWMLAEVEQREEITIEV